MAGRIGLDFGIRRQIYEKRRAGRKENVVLGSKKVFSGTAGRHAALHGGMLAEGCPDPVAGRGSPGVECSCGITPRKVWNNSTEIFTIFAARINYWAGNN
jgi:hypothetical protein